MLSLIEPFSVQPVNIVQVLLFFISIVGSIALWSQSKYRGLVILLSVNAVLMSFNLIEELNNTKGLHLITPALSLAIGPSIYFFTYQLVFQSNQLKLKSVIHFLPVLFAIPFTQYVQVVLAIGTMTQIVYLAFSFPLIHRFHNATKALRSDAEEMNLNWLIGSLAILSALVILDVVRLNLQTHLDYIVTNTWYFVHLTLILILFTFIVIKALDPTSVFKDLRFYEGELLEHENFTRSSMRDREVDLTYNQKDTMTNIKSARKTAPTVTLSPSCPSHTAAKRKVDIDSSDNDIETRNEVAHLEPLFEAINAQIVTNQLFLDPRLSLRNLSDLIGVNEKEISTAINVVAKKNFNDYINGQRITYAVSRLNADYQGSILDLALSSGYNAKSTFNSAFKRNVGMTPSKFLQGC